jgi:hypothetical protein
VTIGSKVSLAFATDFTSSPPPQVTANEAQAAAGDSGGGLFFKPVNGSNWELGGLLFAISTRDNPPTSAYYGDLTYAVDLSFYRSAILAVTTRPACSDGIDDDGDGLTDYPADPGCKDPASALENPGCDDDLDNDGDGTVDWDGGAALGTPDAYCVNHGSWENRETPSGCGLGAELAVLIPLLACWRRRSVAA